MGVPLFFTGADCTDCVEKYSHKFCFDGNCRVGELLLKISDFDKFFYGEYYEKA